MIYNGFDPGTLAWLAGEDRLPATSGEVRFAGNKLIAMLAPSLPEEVEHTAMRLANLVRETPVTTSAGAISATARFSTCGLTQRKM